MSATSYQKLETRKQLDHQLDGDPVAPEELLTPGPVSVNRS
jgi:hypothetical protein